MRLETPRTKRSEPDLTGLINVVFLILIFFIVAGSLRPYAGRDLKLAKATAKGGEAVRSSHLIIAADGTIRYRGSDITLEALRARLREEAAAMNDAAALGIVCTIVEPAQPGEGNGSRAHRAWFQRHMKVRIGKPLGTKRCTGGTDNKDFRMCGRVVEFAGPVAGARDDRAILDDHRAYRHFAAFGRRPRFFQRSLHGGGRRVTGHSRSFLSQGLRAFVR